MRQFGIVAASVVCAALLAGCQTVGSQGTESLLSAAGFQQRLADTPARQAQMNAMPQDTLVRHDVGGTPRWTYADAQGCNCIYAGGQNEYNAFQRLREEREVAEMNQAAALNAQMDWDLWGPWIGPW
ncbi:MAG: hypothetical protein AAF724_05305 [Pseudomonadota bacterium]